MATSAGVLERSEKRTFLDDTVPLSITIINHRVIPKQNYVEYVLRVQRGPAQEDCWEVYHRYSDFTALATELQPSGIALILPPKKMFGKTDRQFISERQQGLESFLHAILAEPLLSNRLEVKRFLDPRNYSDDFSGIALRNVSMFFRSEPTWYVVEPLRDVGWRIRKQYYRINNRTDPTIPYLLSWCELGPDHSIGEKEIEGLLKVLKEIKHPFILPPVLANFKGTGFMVVREFIPRGSLKDAIYGKNPKESALVKYGAVPSRRNLSIDNMKQYGRQILEALHFLAEKGFVLGHVHAGNVLICGSSCKLVDTENSLFGVPSPYRHYLVEIKKLRSHIGEAIYSFGHLLYEMCASSPLKKATLDGTCPSDFPKEIALIIESILSPQAIKDGLPTLSDLLANKFFSEGYGVPPSDKPHLRVSSKLKEPLKAHLERMELRLFGEQKKLAQYRRLSKAHESLMSEDEKKKRRKIRKKQMSLQEEGESESYQTTTSLPRQNTIGTSGVTAGAHVKNSTTSSSSTSAPPPQTTTANGGTNRNSNSSNSKNSVPKTKTTPSKAPPPSSSAPPEALPQERGALLGSIHSFAKGKLKKTVTNDRSRPSVG